MVNDRRRSTFRNHLLAAALTVWMIAGAATAAQGDDKVTVELLHDTVVDSAALNLVSGRFGTCFNGQTYQQQAVVSHAGRQYAAYYAHGGALSIARRNLPDGPWQTIHFADYAVDHNDVHNVAVVGICPGDGTIHLSFDHHGDPLHYRRSVPGLATRPDEFRWTAEHFGPVTDALQPGKPLKGLTYPGFFAAPQGRLQMIYRLGGSGDGDWYLAEYDGAAGQWTTLGMLLSRHGTYETSRSRCAYPNPIHYDHRGRLHVTWCWRERPASGIRDLRTNHDVCYAWSDDAGRTWHDNAGELIAALDGSREDVPASISVDTPGIVVRKTRYLWGQMNTTTQAVDPRGRVHVINWQHQQDAERESTDLNTWRYYHYWRDTDGSWHDNPLPFYGRKPQIVFDAAGNAFVVYCEADNRRYHGIDPGGRLTVAAATEAARWTDWAVAWQADRLSVGEPLIDLPRWGREGVLSVYTQDKPAQRGKPSSLRVIDFRAAPEPARPRPARQ